MIARTPAERIDALLQLRAKVDAQIQHALREVNNQPTRKRSRHVVPECGTESAYQRHKHYGEDVDPPCQEAHRLHNRVQYARAKFGEAS
jgi:hypothetical protein